MVTSNETPNRNGEHIDTGYGAGGTAAAPKELKLREKPEER